MYIAGCFRSQKGNPQMNVFQTIHCGEYCFLPTLSALRWLAEENHKAVDKDCSSRGRELDCRRRYHKSAHSNFDPVSNRLSLLGAAPYSVNSSNELSSTPSATYISDGTGIVETVNASGSPVPRYAQGPIIDEPLAELHGRIHDLGSVRCNYE